MSGSQNPPGTYTINLVPPLQSITPGLGCVGRAGTFAGLSLEQLQRALQTAQQALIATVTGGQAVMVSYAEGQGHRQVTYNRTNADELRNVIRELQSAMGIRSRGSVHPRFG